METKINGPADLATAAGTLANSRPFYDALERIADVSGLDNLRGAIGLISKGEAHEDTLTHFVARAVVMRIYPIYHVYQNDPNVRSLAKKIVEVCTDVLGDFEETAEIIAKLGEHFKDAPDVVGEPLTAPQLPIPGQQEVDVDVRTFESGNQGLQLPCGTHRMRTYSVPWRTEHRGCLSAEFKMGEATHLVKIKGRFFEVRADFRVFIPRELANACRAKIEIPYHFPEEA